MDVIVPADGALAVIEALNARYAGEASGRIPDPPPDQFFRVVPVGGFDRDLLTTVPMLTVESFAIDEAAAVQRAMGALGYLLADGRSGSLGGVVCYEVRVVSLPASLPMESLPTHFRYTTTISAALRGAVV